MIAFRRALVPRGPQSVTTLSLRGVADIVPVHSSTVIALHDKDRIDLAKYKRPEEKLEDVKTHTGQKWDSDDYRLIRFATFPKLVNSRRGMDLIHEVPPVAVEGSRTFCDGGGGPLGHPKVFINVDKPGNHACGYCGLRYFKDDPHHQMPNFIPRQPV